jgi:hypothetical protein
MSASSIDICNLALTRLGHATIQAFPPAEESEEARKCFLLYDRIRRTALRAHPWNFATTTVALSQLEGDEILYEWDYVYKVPADCLRVLYIPDPDDKDNFKVPYELRADGVLLTDMPEAKIRYIKDVSDTSLFDEQFVEAFSYRLAADLAMPLTGKAEYANSLTNLYNVTVRAAMASDAKERRRENTANRDFLDARA